MDFESKKIWRYGDDVDTDVIIPARYLAIADWNELAEHAMEDIDTTFAPNVKAGEIMVAGKNFGCGSSREHAPGVIKAKGVPVIIAHSFARIFFRNAINIGLPVVEIGEQVDRIDAGDAIGVDLSKGIVYNLTKNEQYQGTELPQFIQDIAAAGGLVNFAKNRSSWHMPLEPPKRAKSVSRHMPALVPLSAIAISSQRALGESMRFAIFYYILER